MVENSSNGVILFGTVLHSDLNDHFSQTMAAIVSLQIRINHNTNVKIEQKALLPLDDA